MSRRWKKPKERQTPLFDSPPARRGLARTSIEAASSVQHLAPTIRQRILEFIGSREGLGATNEECSRELGISEKSVCPSTNQLWHAGLIRKSGRERPTTSGRSADIWLTTGQRGQS